MAPAWITKSVHGPSAGGVTSHPGPVRTLGIQKSISKGGNTHMVVPVSSNLGVANRAAESQGPWGTGGKCLPIRDPLGLTGGITLVSCRDRLPCLSCPLTSRPSCLKDSEVGAPLLNLCVVLLPGPRSGQADFSRRVCPVDGSTYP